VETNRATVGPFAARRFGLIVVLIAIAAGGLRVGYVLAVTRHDPLVGDQLYYSFLADTLARGDGFRDPEIRDRVVPSADHPPLTSMILTPASWIIGPDGDAAKAHRRLTAQRLTMALVGALTVAAIAFATRAVVAGPRGPTAGLAAAVVAAVYPGLWINDGLLMAESVGALTIALVIWASIRALDEPRQTTMLLLGAAVGLACLARAEALLLIPLLVIPVALTRRGRRDLRPPMAPLRRLIAAGAGCAVVLAPWVIPNLVRFNHPTTLSTNDGLTLIGTNCDEAWSGDSTGLWVLRCIGAVDSNGDGVDDWSAYQRGLPRIAPGQDYSDVSSAYRSAALHYAREHLGRYPRVAAVRIARTWGLYGVRSAVWYNTGEGRRTKASWAAAIGFWILAPVGIMGMFVLRRRRRPAWPLVSQIVAATVVSALFYGLWRFRIGAEVALVIGVGVAIESAMGRLRPAPTGRLAP